MTLGIGRDRARPSRARERVLRENNKGIERCFRLSLSQFAQTRPVGPN